MKSLRKKVLEDYAKDVESGLPFAEDYINKTGDTYQDALRARNLSEEALAQKLLQDTSLSIPDKSAPLSQKESFLNKILEQRYPEVKKPMQFREMDDAAGTYGKGQILLNKELAKNRDPEKLLADVLHEGAHGYDESKKLVTPDMVEDFNKELRKLKVSGVDLKNMDPAQVYELMAKKHHAQVPNLREGTFGLGALKSYLKSGKFKAIPLIGPALAAGAALSSEDASAAIPVLSEADSLGPERGSEDYDIENPQTNPELRRKALEKLMRR